MSLQLDRRGVWNMMGPCLFALIIMISAWVSNDSQITYCPLLPSRENVGRAGPECQPIQTQA